MSLTIHALNLGNIEIDSSLLVLYRNHGRWVTIPCWGYLVLGGGEGPILVDTGYRNEWSLEIMGMKGNILDGTGLENELAKHGLRPADIRYVIHTHLHTDHAGKDDIFPIQRTTVVVNRREVEVAAAYGTFAYQPQDIKHVIDRIYTPGSAWLLDLKYSGPVEVVPGVVCDLAGGHTEGSMNVLVETGDGVACICGDVIYNLQAQIIEPTFQLQFREPRTTGNSDLSIAQERGAVKKVLNSGRWILPMHDQPVKVDTGGKITGRLEGLVVPGPVAPISMP